MVRDHWTRRLLPSLCLLAGILLPSVAPAQDIIDTLRELAVPSPMHRHLEPFVGDWSVTGRLWLEDGSTVEIEGAIEARLLFEGLFLETRLTGQLAGEPYEGRGVLGFDATTDEFVETWFENLGTSIHRFTGRCDSSACRRRTMSTRFIDPVWTSEMTGTHVVTWVDDDTYRHEFSLAHADGREFPQLEFTATRR